MSEPETKKPARADAERPSDGSSDPSAGKANQAKPQAGGADEPSIDTILRIPVVMQVVLGSATMPVANLMKLGRGQVVALDHRVGEPVDIVVNGRVIARGEVVVVDDDSSRFGVSLTEIVGPGVGSEA
ncbi:MAG: flagellar motor switch protein FliN [Pseudomonadota bacterium]